MCCDISEKCLWFEKTIAEYQNADVGPRCSDDVMWSVEVGLLRWVCWGGCFEVGVLRGLLRVVCTLLRVVCGCACVWTWTREETDLRSFGFQEEEFCWERVHYFRLLCWENWECFCSVEIIQWNFVLFEFAQKICNVYCSFFASVDL